MGGARLEPASEVQLPLGVVDAAEPQQEHAEMEAHRGRARELARKRAQPGEGALRGVLAIAADRSGHLGLGVPGRESGGGRVLTLGRKRTAEPLQREAVEQFRPYVFAMSGTLERLELLRRRE